MIISFHTQLSLLRDEKSTKTETEEPAAQKFDCDVFSD